MRANLAVCFLATASLAFSLAGGAGAQQAQTPADADPSTTVEVEYGESRETVDKIGWVLGIPKKLLLWDERAENHAVSPETVEAAADYLAENDVDGVMIRVNQYDPVGEWTRLRENDDVGLGWRATVGTLYTLGYSVVPGRLFGRDWYNPYTDTVHVYSDLSPLALEQAAQAKDVHEQAHPGFYSAVRLVPFVGLVHEARSKEAVFEHVDRTGSREERAEARRVLHPQMGAEVGGQAAVFLPQADAIFQLGGAAVGHAIGRYQASRIEDDYDDAPLEPAEYPADPRADGAAEPLMAIPPPQPSFGGE